MERIEEQFEAEQINDFLRPRFNIAPSQQVPIVRQTDGRRTISLVRWGLVPFWAKDVKIGSSLINARSETAPQTPAFQECFRSRRCLIPADGFYEWSKLQKEKRPFHFGMADDSLFALAGLWDSWKTPDGARLKSCTIPTTSPNSLVSDLHDRMPMILPRESYEKWLAVPAGEASRLLLPFDGALMRRFEVSSLVNSPKNDTADCITPVRAKAILSSQ